MSRLASLLLACGLLAAPCPAFAATAIGKVTRVEGAARGTLAGVTRALGRDDAVHLDEAVTTGEAARLEVLLDDNTVLTLGEKASLRLDAFVYRPERSVLKATIAGAFRFVSAALAGGTSREATVTTSFAVIGVRGTNFWGGPIDGAFGVVLFEGAVSVTNAGVTTNLTAPGESVDLATATAPPGLVTLWPADKVARAAATVAFR
jgi:hypothetical protein